MGTPKTTARAVGLACDALAEQAVPHVALCFAVLFGENASASAAATSAAAAAGGGKPVKMEGTKREKLQSRLLGAMEVTFVKTSFSLHCFFLRLVVKQQGLSSPHLLPHMKDDSVVVHNDCFTRGVVGRVQSAPIYTCSPQAMRETRSPFAFTRLPLGTLVQRRPDPTRT